jgi:hypothetical protein
MIWAASRQNITLDGMVGEKGRKFGSNQQVHSLAIEARCIPDKWGQGMCSLLQFNRCIGRCTTSIIVVSVETHPGSGQK